MAQDEEQAVELLKEIANLRQDIDIHRIIGLNRDAIEVSELSSAFFGHLQFLAHHSIALRICKIYEPPNRFELNSIPGAIANLPETLVSSNHEATLKDFASKYGAEIATDPRDTLRAALQRFVNANSEPLARLREFRNKAAAHSEADFRVTALPSHDAFENFFDFAKDAYGTMRLAFHGVYPALFHRKVGSGLHRLLKAGGIPDAKLLFPRE